MASRAHDAEAKRKQFQNWSRDEPDKATKKVWAMEAKHRNLLGWRHRMAARGAAAYSGCGFGNLFENLTFENPLTERGRAERVKRRLWDNQEEEQHARAIVETVIEKLFGMDEPKTQLVATDAPYEIRRQGIWADRFIEGTFHLEQGGGYDDFWDMARQAALLSYASTGTAAIRTEPDFVAKRVRNTLRSTLNTFIDPADRGADKPLSYFDVTWEHPEYLCADERFKGKEDQIWRCAHIPRHLQHGSYDSATFDTPMVKVITAWRVPFGDFKGRHLVAVAGEGEGSPEDWIYWEDWDSPVAPLAFLRCNRAIGDDFWGENMIEVALRPLADARDIDVKAKLTMKRTSQTVISVTKGATGPEAFLNAKDVVVFRYDPNKSEQPADIVKPGLLNGDYFDWQARKINLAHELTGVSLMHQAGEVQGAAGHRSGRSIRLEASMLPERFARKLRSWRNFVAVHAAKNHIRAAKLIGERDPDWTVTWPGADFEAQVKVKVLDIDVNQFTIRPYAVSEQKNTPADRADAAQEMYDRGEINDSQLTLILEGLYDTKYEAKAATVERAYVAKTIDEILHGEESLIEDENRYMQDEYMPPMPWHDPQALLAAASPKYTQAMIDKVPQNRRALLRRFMEDIWAARQQQIREEKLQEASLNIAAQTSDPFAAAGGMPGAHPSAPPVPGISPGTPMPAGPAPGLGGPPMPAGLPAPPLNAPGAPGMV
jgi:hypothetical protein